MAIYDCEKRGKVWLPGQVRSSASFPKIEVHDCVPVSEGGKRVWVKRGSYYGDAGWSVDSWVRQPGEDDWEKYAQRVVDGVGTGELPNSSVLSYLNVAEG